MKKELTKEAIAIRKLREIKGLERKEAGLLLEVSPKTIESFENGRNPLSREKLSKYISLYGFSTSDFDACLAGNIDQIKEKYGAKKKKIIENNFLRRSYKRIVTKEVKVLVVLRRLREVSQYQASRLCGYSESSIGHIEAGRIELSLKRICHIVESYGFTMDDFNYHLNGTEFVTEIQDQCILVIRKLSKDQLKIVQPLLETFGR